MENLKWYNEGMMSSWLPSLWFGLVIKIRLISEASDKLMLRLSSKPLIKNLVAFFFK